MNLVLAGKLLGDVLEPRFDLAIVGGQNDELLLHRPQRLDVRGGERVALQDAELGGVGEQVVTHRNHRGAG
ncbi:hypothetical protein DL240_14525 [Lujinxingia litoralis]|uniref:Uncharacterized protein n=1 Tax=Lujinxingia litoralis TaxID=2211119 RepID=A0A328C2L8_9DELT|nr:hypothetical protein DL240_14525 [Lujinxingia litoralis]